MDYLPEKVNFIVCIQLECYLYGNTFVHFGLNNFSDQEWGYGNTSPEIFNPTDLNCEQWVKLFKEIGMQGVILTPTEYRSQNQNIINRLKD